MGKTIYQLKPTRNHIFSSPLGHVKDPFQEKKADNCLMKSISIKDNFIIFSWLKILPLLNSGKHLKFAQN